MKITIVKDLCIGDGSCVSVAPKVFALDDEGKAIVIDTHGADDETIKLAAESCPVAAIILTDEQTNKQIFP